MNKYIFTYVFMPRPSFNHAEAIPGDFWSIPKLENIIILRLSRQKMCIPLETIISSTIFFDIQLRRSLTIQSKTPTERPGNGNHFFFQFSISQGPIYR